MARVRLCVCGSWFVGREGQAAHPRAPGQCLHFECRGAPARVRCVSGCGSHGACNASECSPRLAQRRPSSQSTVHRLLKKHSDECGTGDAWQAGHDAVVGCCVSSGVTLCVSGIVRAVHQSSSKLGDTPLVRLDLFESLPSRRVGCRASYNKLYSKIALYIALTGDSHRPAPDVELYSSTALYISTELYSALHSTS